MTDDEHRATPASLRLTVAIDQLTQPAHHTLDRSAPATRKTRDEADRAHLHHTRTLRWKLAQARDDQDRDRLIGALREAGRRHRAQRAALTTGHAVLPPLLDQLSEAVANSSNTGGSGGGPAAHRSPVGLAALALLTDIQHYIGNRDRTHLAADLRTWTTAEVRSDDDAHHAEQWVEKARAILAPSKRSSLHGRCLNCDRGTVHLPDDTGEIVRRPALEVDRATTATRCLACGYRWPPERAHLLASALEQQQHEDAHERAQRATARAAR